MTTLLKLAALRTHGPEQRHRHAPRSIAPRAPLAGVRVLAVDDDLETREMLSALLAAAGAEVRTASSGREALAALAAWRATVILSDISMPGQDGYDLIAAIRAQPATAHIPAAALTAYGRREEDRARALAAGFQVQITKPADAEELIGALARLARAARFPR